MTTITTRARFLLNDQADDVARIRAAVAAWGTDPGVVPPPTAVAAGADPAVAYVNHGRWIARCPDELCNNGQPGVMYAEPDTPFYCTVCANVSIGHLWRPVQWPPERAAIEAELGRRSYPHQRNWTPGETVEHLRTERLLLTGVVP